MGAKHQKLLLGNNAPGKCLLAHIQHFFSPSPANEEKFAESAFFHTKIKHLSWSRWIYELIEAKHQTLLLGNNSPGKCVQAHMQHFFSPSPAMEKKFAESAFFTILVKIKNLSWNAIEFTSQWGQNTKNYSWATMPLASAFSPTYNISSALAQLMRKNSLSQHFFIQKTKTCHETVEFTSQWGQNTKNYSWATIPLASAFRPTCNISSALAALSRKNSLSQHFFSTKIKILSWNHWIYEPMGAKHQKLLLGNNAPGKCLLAHIQHFFSPSPANEEKFAESAFFHTKIKHLSWSRWIYELIEAKHQTLLLGNNSPGKCVQAHMQHFFSPSPAMEKKFAESAFFHTKIKNLSWNRWIYEPMGAKHQKLLLGNNATGKCLQAHMQHFFSPSRAIEKNSLSQHFFLQKSKSCHETIEFTSQWGQNQKLSPTLGNNAPGKCLLAQTFLQP